VITGDDGVGGGGGGGGGGEVSNGTQGKHKHRKSVSDADFFRLDKFQEVDLLNQSGSKEESISGAKDEVIR
jgi:hypothetical protein